MANRITKDVANIDPNMLATQAGKRKSVVKAAELNKMKTGTAFHGNAGFGTDPDQERLDRQKNYAKADYIEPPEPSMHELLQGKMPNPVKQPTMKNIGTTEPTKAHLKGFSSDEAVQSGHMPIPGTKLSQLHGKK